MEGLFASSRRLRNTDGYRDVREAIVENKARIGICSFSEVYDHELMWAHYAEEFKGICIGYSFSRLLSHLEDNVEFVRMYYDEKVPTVRHNSEPPLLIAKKILSCKNYRWLYEREWRMFAPLGRVPITLDLVSLMFTWDREWSRGIAMKLQERSKDFGSLLVT
jgi:Protein of unknown function (DUF2971)